MTDQVGVNQGEGAEKAQPAIKSAPKKKKAKSAKEKSTKGTRTHRIYPSLSFEEAISLAEAIEQFASGERVSRLTLLQKLNKSPTSSATQILITCSGKYGITTGSFKAEHLELTEVGRVASNPHSSAQDKLRARFQLAIEQVEPFSTLYHKYKSKKLPAHEVLIDTLKEAKYEISNFQECIDIFIVNIQYLGLLQVIAGSETLLPVETVLEQLNEAKVPQVRREVVGNVAVGSVVEPVGGKEKWANVCFYITPIGDDASEQRKHSDLFLSQIVEPALKNFNLKVIRADQIGEPGMITAQILEHIVYSRLVIVDLSYHNPNVFYEMATRHMCKLPVIQICRKADKIPFDVNQVRTITIDTTDIYSLLPKIETYKTEISTQARAALDGQITGNPISIFFPTLEVKIPKN